MVWHAERPVELGAEGLVRAIGHRVGAGVLVWNQKLCAVARLYRHIPGAERSHPTRGAAHLDHLARLDRLVEQQDDLAEQVRDVRCSPSPTPTPSAPVNSAKVMRSITMLVSENTTAKVTRVALISLPRSTRARG